MNTETKQVLSEECTHKQPNAANCFVCGRDNEGGLKMKFYDNGVDTVQSTLLLDQRFEGYPGIIHGGILASILDEVIGRVAMVEDHHHFMMTVYLNIKYRNPVPVGTQVKAEGKAIRMGGRIGKASGKILLPDGQVACEAEMALADMPKDIASESRLDSLGWAVDPD